MIKNILSTVFVIFISNIVYSQNTHCNRDVWAKQDAKKIPKEVCIPNGYLISNVYEPVDLNEDGRPDFIFKWRRSQLQDGDTIFVTVYLQNSDSTYSYFRTFSNLYPIYFKDYDLEYTPKDTALVELHQKYEGEYKFLELKLKPGLFIIRIKYEAKEDLIVQYHYDESKKDWVYQKAELDDYALNSISPIDLSDKLGPSIDNFNYFYWEK